MNRRPGSGGDPYGGGLGAPVAPLREPWSVPQHVPGSPHNLPPINARPQPPGAPGAMPIFDAHHYARNTVTLQNSLTTASVLVALSNSQLRNMLGFRNTSNVAGENIYISFGVDASATSWLVLEPGESVFFDTVVPQDDVYAVAETGTPILATVYSLIA